ncbi:hypothetical protein BX667DRAFT_494463 [Coemansia mojavensis]|nr:hypothetical protein BX667DRAFT_494463 [Coemansia mojavensis]
MFHLVAFLFYFILLNKGNPYSSIYKNLTYTDGAGAPPSKELSQESREEIERRPSVSAYVRPSLKVNRHKRVSSNASDCITIYKQGTLKRKNRA